MDRVLDNLGLTNPPPGSQDGRMLRAVTSPVRFSPPEELPQPRETSGPPVPTSWASTMPQPPLFGPNQVAQMRQAQRDFPQIYGYQAASEGDSDRSSRLQAEVQRQLDEYISRHQSQMSTLMREVQTLRAEREEWRARATYGELGGNPQSLSVDPGVPRGSSQHLPPGDSAPLPEGILGGQGYPPTLPVDPGVPQGSSQHLPQREHAPLPRVHVKLQEDPQSLSVDPGVPRGSSQHLPHGELRGKEKGSATVSKGTKEDTAVSRESEQSSKNGLGHQHDPQSLPVDPGVPRGSSQHLPHGHQQMNGTGADPSSTSAQQWLGTGQSQDAMTLMAGGVAQLQAAMLKQMNSDKHGDRSPEAVKPGTPMLPSLPPVRPSSSSVDLLDWLELIESPMSDLSDGSATWWRQVRSTASSAYDKWVVSGPIERLGITPALTSELEEGRWSRVNSRASSMILASLDETIRSELVSRRMTGSVASIVFRLLTLYQPGGEEEKFRTLQQLQSPPGETEPMKAVETLRSWNRCKELNLQVPDPSLLVRGLNVVVKGVMDKHNEASFRTNLVRSNLKIDSNPTTESVDKYYKHLMGECEALATAMSITSTTTVVPTPKADPKLRPIRADTRTMTPPPAPTSQPPRSPSQNTSASGGEEDKRGTTPCKFFGKTYKGCGRLGKCPFLHSWDGLEKEKASRCLACGGKHMVKDCPNKKAQGNQGNQRGAPEPKGPQATPKAPATPSTTTAAATKTVRIDEIPEMESVEPRTAASGAVETSTADLRDVLADVGKVLKAVSATTIKKISVSEAVDASEPEPETVQEAAGEDPLPKLAAAEARPEHDQATGLLDSGASHPTKMGSRFGLPLQEKTSGSSSRTPRARS